MGDLPGTGLCRRGCGAETQIGERLSRCPSVRGLLTRYKLTTARLFRALNSGETLVSEGNELRQKRPVADEMRCEPYDTLNGEDVSLRHVTHVVNSAGLAGEKPTMIRGQGCSCSWISQKLCKLEQIHNYIPHPDAPMHASSGPLCLSRTRLPVLIVTSPSSLGTIHLLPHPEGITGNSPAS
jgi:hypothetical protein